MQRRKKKMCFDSSSGSRQQSGNLFGTGRKDLLKSNTSSFGGRFAINARELENQKKEVKIGGETCGRKAPGMKLF